MLKYSHPLESITLTNIGVVESKGDGTINVKVGGTKIELVIFVQ
jgi:hypothetical protein